MVLEECRDEGHPFIHEKIAAKFERVFQQHKQIAPLLSFVLSEIAL